jgi:hypothetical protein
VLTRHGTEAGYKAELMTENVCERCRAAHRVYAKQYTKVGKKAGLKYGRHDIIDQLDTSKRGRPSAGQFTARHNAPARTPEPDGDGAGEQDWTMTGTTLGERLAARVGALRVPDSGSDYIPVDDPPDYLHSVDPDPEPDGAESQPIPETEFVINAKGMEVIENNLGMYLSVVGMTVDMIDPYCGPILADNFDKIVSKWAKVIAHYPSAANLFLDGKGGIIFGWISAIQATWPFLYAIYEHHLARTVTRDQDGNFIRKMNGRPMRVTDATAPPMPDTYEYAAA